MKIKSIFLGFLVIFISIINVDAITIEYGTTKSTIKTGESVLYELKLKDVGTSEFNLIEFEVDIDEKLLSFESVQDSDYDTKQEFSGKKGFIAALSGNFAEGATFAAFKITNLSQEKGTTELSLKNIKFKNGEDVVESINEKISKTLTLSPSTTAPVSTTTEKVKNTSAKVKSLNVKNATMKPAFNESIHEYKLYTKDAIRQITLLYDTEQGGVVLASECSLGCSVSTSNDAVIQLCTDYPCKNEVEFTFTSEDGKDTQKYKYTIYRGVTTDGSNKLTSLGVKDFELNEKFSNDSLDYTLTVPFDTESLEVNAISEDSEAKVKIKGNDKLDVGENVITITVTPTDEDAELKIYNITVTREEFREEENGEDKEQEKELITKEKEKKDNSDIIIIVFIVVGLIIIGVSAYFIFFYKGKDKKKNKNIVVDEEDAPMPKARVKSVIDDAFEEKEPTSIEDALDDLMKTKEINKDIEED